MKPRHFAVILVLPAILQAQTWTTTPQPNLAKKIAEAPPLKVENVSQPTQTTRHESPIAVPNAEGTADILVVYYKGYQGPATVFATDTNTGEVTRAEVPRGRNVHMQGSVIAPNGKRYAALQMVGGGLEIWAYDPAANTFSAIGKVGEELNLMGQGNALTLGPDGKIYGTVGARKTGEAGFFRIDPDGDVVDVLGSGGAIQGSPYVQGLAIAESGKIYAAYGKTPYRLIEFDPTTKSARELATANPRGGIRLRNAGGNVTFAISGGETGAEGDGTFQITAGGEISKTAGLQLLGKNLDLPGKPRVSNPKLEFRRLVSKGLSPAEAKARVLGKNPENPGKPTKIAKKRGLGGGVRQLAGIELDASKLDPAQNPDSLGHLRYKTPESEAWATVRFDPPLYAEALIQLTTLPDGRLFGTATNRAGHFVHDPNTDKTTFLGRTGLQHHSSALSGGRVYLSGYPSSMVWSWDFTGPAWTEPAPTKMGQGKFGSTPPDDNPRRLGVLREFSGVHMATCAATDNQGRVYFAGRWYRDGNGGGLGWWDPANEQAGGFWEPLSNLQVADCTAVADGRFIVLSTLRVADKVLKRDIPDEARLCVIDAENPDKIAKTLVPIPGARTTGLIAPAGGNRLLGIAPNPADPAQWLIYGVDIATGETAFTKPIPGIPEGGKISSAELLHNYRNALAVAPDGTIWLKHLGALLRIHPQDARVEVLGRPVLDDDAIAGLKTLREDERTAIRALGMLKADGAPATIGRMAFAGDDVYLTGTPWLRRIRGIAALGSKQ